MSSEFNGCQYWLVVIMERSCKFYIIEKLKCFKSLMPLIIVNLASNDPEYLLDISDLWENTLILKSTFKTYDD